MDNVFRIGGQVSGDSFIGRKDFVKMLRKKFIENNERMAKSLVGLPRTGKTSAVKNAFSEGLPDNILYVYEDVNEYSNENSDENSNENASYVELWQGICLTIKEELEKKHFKMGEIEDWILSITESDHLPWIKMKSTIKKIFGSLSDAGIKTILVLDEFDAADKVFGKVTRHFELFRTIFSDGEYNVSPIIISRRKLHTIEGTTYQSSTFHGVFGLEPFQGFDNTDMAEYFEVFQKNGIKLSKKQQKKMMYYAGNSPYLLSIMGHYMIEAAKEAGKIDIDDIFQKKCTSINDYYRDCIKYLEKDNDLKRIVPFLFGPNVGVTKMDKDELFQLGYFREDDKKLVAISEYFVQFLSANMLQAGIWDNIISLEKKLKQLIERELTRIVKHYEAGGNDFDEILQSIMDKVQDIKKGDINKYNSYYDKNKKKFPESNPSYLDVISMGDVISIMKECWGDIFAAYFKDDLYMNWQPKLDKCVFARNPVAHGTDEKYLSDLEKKEVDIFCKQIFDMLSDTIKTVIPDSESYLEVAKKYTQEAPEISPPAEELVDIIISMKITGVGTSGHKNLKGIIVDPDDKERCYHACIPQNELEGVILREKVGGCFKVKINRIDRGVRYMVSPCIGRDGDWVLG